MAYSKQNFQNGQILNAANLEAMENGIIAGQGAYNLLDNSDFRNPVNQRDATSWTAHGVYCIDRWKTESANNAANISYTAGSGITLTPSSTNYAGIIQQFENYSSMTGKAYTIAICVNNIWYSGTFTMGATPSGGVVLSNGIRIYSASGYNVLIRNPAGQSAITIQRAALYEGSYDASTLPAYQPKGYAAELAECQRYYRTMYYPVIPCANNPAGTQVYGFLPFRMRIAKPSVSCDTLYFFKGDTTFYSVSSTSAASYGTGTRIVFDLSQSVEGNLAGAIAGNRITLNADL